jgi:hypothetical protein
MFGPKMTCDRYHGSGGNCWDALYTVTVTVTNIGKVAGDEVAKQLPDTVELPPNLVKVCRGIRILVCGCTGCTFSGLEVVEGAIMHMKSITLF